MFCEKGYELLEDLIGSLDNLPPFDVEGFRQVLEECTELSEEGNKDMESALESSVNHDLLPSVSLRDAAFERNNRCISAYIFNRLQRIRKMRWELGSALPSALRGNLSSNESYWLTKYSIALADYMGKISRGAGLDIMQNMKPPKFLNVQVKSLVDFGRFELLSGETLWLKKNGVYNLPRLQCEALIRQGILENVS